VSGARVGAQPGAAGRFSRLRTAGIVVGGIICVLVLLHVIWLVRFRRGYVTEWDESGYLQFSLSNFDDLHDHGFSTFARTVGSRGTFGPLLPFVTSLAYPIVGRGIFGSLLVLPLFFAGLVGASFGLARRLVSDSWAVLAALAVAAIPAVTDYTRLFHFALPATACMTAALWALLRSDGFRRPTWAAAFGLFVALTLLSRTMTVAYLPAFALAAGSQFLVRAPGLGLRLRNLAIAVGTTGLIAGPWYLANARSVYDLLLNSGYGEGATPFGRHYHVASWGYWTKELRLDLSYMWLPLAVALLASFGFAFAYFVARRRRQRPIRANLPQSAHAAAVLALVLVVLEGYLVLTSSRNEGTAFALPWLPALVVLGVTAAASIPTQVTRVVLAGSLVVVSLGAVLAKSGWFEPLAKTRTVAVPGLGHVLVTEGRGLIQREVGGDGYDITPVTHPLPALHRRWLPLAREVVGWSLHRAHKRGEPLNLTLGLDDRIFGNSRLTLAAQLWFHRYLSVDYLSAFPDGDSIASFHRQLQPENALITGEPPPSGSKITRSKVEAAARALGFVQVKSFPMPDGRTIWVWWREHGSNS
jgi:dolichyl-phosphate-mannose-protein mannosyltransferase